MRLRSSAGLCQKENDSAGLLNASTRRPLPTRPNNQPVKKNPSSGPPSALTQGPVLRHESLHPLSRISPQTLVACSGEKTAAAAQRKHSHAESHPALSPSPQIAPLLVRSDSRAKRPGLLTPALP